MSIVFDQVVKSYGGQKPVVNDISLEIGDGEFFVLLGASGSGKSTLLRLIAGLMPLDSGRILLHGRDVTNIPTQKRNIGFVFQNYSLFRHMTVAKNIEFGLSIRHASRAARSARVDELLKLIGMEGLGDRMPSQISGGQQQRVALARALAYEPEVLLLDEPFGALDAKIRVQLRQNLRDIQRQLGVTTILVTHDQDEAFELADRIGIIEGGHLIEVGTPDELYRRPRHQFTATFLGTANLLKGRRNSHYVYWGETSLLAPENTEHLSDQPVTILSRPEEVEIASKREAITGQLLGQGLIEGRTFAGPVEKLSIRLLDDHQEIPLQASVSGTQGIEPGQEVWIGLKHFHLLPRHDQN